MHRALFYLVSISALTGCADAVTRHNLERGCYLLTPVEKRPQDMGDQWPSSFELADSNRVLPGADSLSAKLFWQMHQMSRKWYQAATGTTVTFSTGEVMTDLTLQAVGDSVFGAADFPTDAVGPPVPHFHVTGHRVPCPARTPVG